MSAWRRRAIASFPDLRRDIESPDYSIMLLFFDLLPMVRAAHETGNTPALATIYAFAEWCAAQREQKLWNAAGVGFYEHLFDAETQTPWAQIVPWLSPHVIRDVWTLWETRLSPDQIKRLRILIARQSTREM